ncbi:MAG: nucleotidyltransferase family protein [Myxococcota bacterium]
MVSDATIKRYARIYREEARRDEEARRRVAREVLDRSAAVATMLREDFGAERVGYFGSLVTGRLEETSDVDLYVDRIRRGGYFRAIDRATDALGRHVDLVELERAPESLREVIARDGVDVDG